MALADYIARQARHPRGLFGRLLAQIWVYESAAANGVALDLLEIEPRDRVLEIGFGHGRTIQRAAAKANLGFVAGIDSSDLMEKVARRRNRRLLQEGRVDLRCAEAGKLPFPDKSFDKVFSVHTIYFWDDPSGTLDEIKRVLRSRGRLVLGFRARDDGASPDHYPPGVYTFRSREEIRSMLEASGYGEVRVEAIRGSGNAPSWAVATAE